MCYKANKSNINDKKRNCNNILNIRNNTIIK